MTLKDQLRSARARAGMTQEQVAHAAGMHVTQYNGYETGRSRPLANTLARIGTALGASVEELTSENGIAQLRAGREAQFEVDWENTRDVLQALTAARLGIDAGRVRVEIHVD